VTSSSSDVGRHQPGDRCHPSLSRRHPSLHRYPGPHALPFSASPEHHRARDTRRREVEPFLNAACSRGDTSAMARRAAERRPRAGGSVEHLLGIRQVTTKGHKGGWPARRTKDCSSLRGALLSRRCRHLLPGQSQWRATHPKPTDGQAKVALEQLRVRRGGLGPKGKGWGEKECGLIFGFRRGQSAKRATTYVPPVALQFYLYRLNLT
jgi:hypothetical protein